VLGDENGVHGVRIRNARSGETARINVQGCFIAIGHQPNTEIFRGPARHDGRLHPHARRLSGLATMTSVPGVFAAGDVQDSVYRRPSRRPAADCMAALDAQRWLEAEAPTQATPHAAVAAK